MCAAHVNLVSSVSPKYLTSCFVDTSRPLNVIGNILYLCKCDKCRFVRVYTNLPSGSPTHNS